MATAAADPPPARPPLPLGKLPAPLLAALLGELGPPPAEVLLGPAPGEDACVLAVERGALVVATDPVTLTGGAAGVARLAVIVNANDVAVTGVRPRWFLATVLFPSGTTEDDVRALFAELRATLDEVGAVAVGGHTEVTAAVRQTVVVGQMLGLADDGAVVRTGGAVPGDVLVQVGRVPVEGAAVLAGAYADVLGSLPAGVVREAAAASTVPGLSVVEPALAAAALGATSLHDPTEGGLACGLAEVAGACAAAVRVDTRQLLWFAPGVAVCRALGADPLATLASGCLLAAFPPDRLAGALDGLAAGGFDARVIGRLEVGSGVSDETGRALLPPARDEVARLAEAPPGR